jgi:hypothetical protein
LTKPRREVEPGRDDFDHVFIAKDTVRASGGVEDSDAADVKMYGRRFEVQERRILRPETLH